MSAWIHSMSILSQKADSSTSSPADNFPPSISIMRFLGSIGRQSGLFGWTINGSNGGSTRLGKLGYMSILYSKTYICKFMLLLELFAGGVYEILSEYEKEVPSAPVWG
jgi:hypothetical protein